jgi:hypothetical protein
MNELDTWILLDGPEPEIVRPILDALRELPPKTPDEKEQWTRRFFEKLDAHLAQREQPPVATPPKAPTTVTFIPTVRAPDVRWVGDNGAPAKPPTPHVSIAAAPPIEPPAPPRRVEPYPWNSQPGPVRASDNLTSTVEVPSRPYIGTGDAAFYPLTPVGYGALRAELAFSPEREEEILLKFGLKTKAAREALDAYCRAELAGSAEARELFEQCFAQATRALQYKG